MGALAAAGWAWSVRGDTRYGGKWAWLAWRGPCTASRPEWQAGRNGSVRVCASTVRRSTVCPRKNAPPPKYNGVVFEILGKHHWNFYNRIRHIFEHCLQKFVEIWRKGRILLHVFNYSSKTQVSVTTRTHARSQLFPMKQCDYSSIVVTYFLTKNFN